MTITQGIVTQAKVDWMSGVHQPGDTYKIALYTDAAEIGPGTSAYTATGEVANGNGYTTGGATLSDLSIALDGTVAVMDFSNPVWANSSFTARGFMIYNASRSNAAIYVGDFGENITSVADNFTVILPTPDATNGLIRIE